VTRIVLAALTIAAVLGVASAHAASSVSTRLSDFKVRATPSSTEHGRVTFNVRNTGAVDHELIVIKTSRQANALPLRNGRASTRGEKGQVDVDAGETGRLRLNLTAGHYVLICNIGGHYQAGMRANFTVR
jgi:uncharacterized cupredoxin-like copper-binding protein